jgi:CBS domain-containing protein
MNAADIMTQPVISVTPETKIAEAARLLLQHRISGLPVVDSSGAVVGIVTEGDLLRRSELGTERHRPRWVELLIGPGRLAGDYVDAHARKVGEVMSENVASVTPQETLPEIVWRMETRHIKRLPVIDDGRLVGIVSRATLVRALVRTLTRPAANDAKGIRSDEEIRDRILAEIRKEPWGPRSSVDVTVKNGVAELYGSITDERERTALQVAAVSLLRQYLPELKIRVVNVVDLMTLQPHEEHSHGLTDRDFDALFTTDKPVIFAHHGYPWLIHRLTYRRTNHRNLHVRGYKEEGTTTTPFDMVVMNDLDRFHLAADVIDRLPQLGYLAAYAKQAMRDKLIEHKAYIRKYGEDMPEVSKWRWSPAELSAPDPES